MQILQWGLWDPFTGQASVNNTSLMSENLVL